jgi:hypothetical protein
MQKPVRIINPVSDCQFTSRNRAARFVRKGRAEWVHVGKSIRFVSSDRQHQSAKNAADKTRTGYDRAASAGMAKMRAMANLPMTSPSAALGIGRRKGATRHTFLAAQGWVPRS